MREDIPFFGQPNHCHPQASRGWKPGARAVPIERPQTLDMVMERSLIDMKRKIFGLLYDELEEEH